jgi:hypothetical protein
VNISIVIDCQLKHQGLIDGTRDVLPLVFGLDVIGNIKGTKTQKPRVKSALDTNDTGISARTERSKTTLSNLQMHETLSGLPPSQAEMELDVIGWVNVADGQDFIALMVDYSAGYGISNRLLRDLS